MICKLSLSILTVVVLSLAAQAQEKEKPVPVQIRAVLHDPVHPIADLFYTDETGVVVPFGVSARRNPRSLRASTSTVSWYPTP